MGSLKLSIIQSFYLIYMFLFFKTSTDFNILSSPKGWWLEHLTDNTYDLRICRFGRVVIFGLIGVLILRHFFNIPKKLFNIIMGISVLLSLLNMNAVVYLIPVWVVEYYYN